MAFIRYAVFYTPPSGALADFGARWLGWDPKAGSPVDHLSLSGTDLPRITETPRKYGLHGTLKPPFRLAKGTSGADLAEALADLAPTLSPAQVDGLTLSRIGRFLALTPVGEAGEINALAATTVTELDPFRAPMTAKDLEKRAKPSLSPRQLDLLGTWGYPYVIDQFRFHITLTGPLPDESLEAVEAALPPLLDGLLPAPFVIEALVLLGEDEDGFFHELQRFPLGMH